MTQLLIDRATLEQLIESLETCSPGDYSTGYVIHPSFDAKAVDAAITAGRASLANAEPTGWQKIETAPATANNVLAFSESGNMKIETGFWLINMLHAANIDGEKCNYTHWMPLPAAPGETP